MITPPTLNNIIFIDIESSGLYHESYPIEIGYGCTPDAITSFLITPENTPDWQTWSEEGEAIHKITRDMLYQSGISPLAAAQKMNDDLHGKCVYSNAPEFDWNWIRELFFVVGERPEFTIRDSIEIYKPGLVLVGGSEDEIAVTYEEINAMAWDKVGKWKQHRVTPDVLQQLYLAQLISQKAQK
mgnify:CR=1 FL=1